MHGQPHIRFRNIIIGTIDSVPALIRRCDDLPATITHVPVAVTSVPTLVRRCDDLPATITHVPVAAVLVLNTPDDGRLMPETCRVTLQK